MTKETFEANPTLLADYLKLGYMRYLEAERKSTMETIVKITQEYADEPHKGTNAWAYKNARVRLDKELQEIEAELEKLFKAEEEGCGFIAELSKLTFWEAGE